MDPQFDGYQWIIPIRAQHLRRAYGRAFKGKSLTDNDRRVVVAVTLDPVRPNGATVAYFGWTYRANGHCTVGHDYPHLIGWNYTDKDHQTITPLPDDAGADARREYEAIRAEFDE